MILFKGRSCLKQYCPMKPIKRGFKMWVRADSDGYMSRFEVYQGKGTGTGREGFGLGESVVLNLCEDILGKGQKVFFDNYFTSLPILAHLRRNETWSCGTIRSNRKGLPAGLTDDKDLNRGDFDFRVSNDDITFFKWMDVKCVHVASNHSTKSTVVNRTQKDGTRAEIQCPQAIFDYNVFMGGVDKADMLCGLYGVSRKKDRGSCEVCSSKGIQSRPHSKCHICDVFLCSNGNKNCFLDFHGIAQ
ncbi:hypothetical protein RRG08_031518 [Elysia crispata]|uniref:PiggyBac transposable element-derived protein domain-containing protein n=1 Tax=Elysia crispata TaxID=231223 RepID=A0AAE1CER9_9GAST|nr:hypothetical protein RRG08_031518 [Elysia crispata]